MNLIKKKPPLWEAFLCAACCFLKKRPYTLACLAPYPYPIITEAQQGIDEVADLADLAKK